MLPRTLFCWSLSKVYTMTGDRFGWVSVGDPTLAPLLRVSWMNGTATLPAEWQLRFMAFFEHIQRHPEIRDKVSALYALRRRALIHQLRTLNNEYQLFQRINLDDGGTIYNWSQFSEGQDVFSVFARTGIAGVPGTAFGYGDDHVRFSVGIEPVPGWEQFVDGADAGERPMKKLLSGNEAAARGAWEAGAAVASGYPGTPSTEILETFARFPGVYAEWAPNEKVAVDVAIGAAYAGSRAFATMKHVGLERRSRLPDVCRDDRRRSWLGHRLRRRPRDAFQPERAGQPHLREVRAHSLPGALRQPAGERPDARSVRTQRALRHAGAAAHDHPRLPLDERGRARRTSGDRVRRARPINEGLLGELRIPTFPRNPAKYVMVPGNAIKRHPLIEQRLQRIAEYAETFAGNVIEAGDPELGIITSRIAYQYVKEVFPTASVLHLGMTWPLPHRLIHAFAASVKRLIVVEELDPFIEEGVRLMGIPSKARGSFPSTGELNPHVVRESAISAGLLPESACVPPVEVDVGELARAPAGPLPRLRASRLVL